MIERDQNVNERLALSESDKAKIEEIVKALETARDNDSESIITDERYNYITDILKGVLKKSGKHLTLSDKVDRIVTNRILGLPIFLLVMWAVYYISVTTVGSMATDWTNDDFVGGIMEAVEEGYTEPYEIAKHLRLPVRFVAAACFYDQNGYMMPENLLEEYPDEVPHD